MPRLAHSSLKENWHKKDKGYFNTNDMNIVDPVRNVDENFHWSENNDFIGRKKYMCRIKQLKDWIDTGYRSQIEALLSPTFSWPLYHPDPTKALSINKSGQEDPSGVRQGHIYQSESGFPAIERLMMDYPGWIGDGALQQLAYDNKSYVNHEELFNQHGPISKIVVHSGDRIDGIEVFYGGQSAKIIGRKAGSRHETLELRPGESLTGLWANDYGDSGSIPALKLQATREDGQESQVVQCGHADAWKYSFNGHEGGLQGGNTMRLLWLSGGYYDDWISGWVLRMFPVFQHYQTWGPLR